MWKENQILLLSVKKEKTTITADAAKPGDKIITDKEKKKI